MDSVAALRPPPPPDGERFVTSEPLPPAPEPTEAEREVEAREFSLERVREMSTRGRRELARTPGVSRPLIEAARQYVGVREKPPGSNRGPQITEWQCSLGPALVGAAWCGTFAHRVAEDAGLIAPFVEGRRRAWAKAWATDDAIPIEELRHAPMPGWLLVYDRGARGGHVEFVADTTGWPRSLGVIGGNISDPEGSCRTCGVFEGIRRLAPGARMRPNYTVPTITI